MTRFWDGRSDCTPRPSATQVKKTVKPALATAAPLPKITEPQIEFASPKNLFAKEKNILEEILEEEDTTFRIFLLSQCFPKCE